MCGPKAPLITTSLSYIPTCRFVGIYVGKVNIDQISVLSPGLSGISPKDPVIPLGIRPWNLSVAVVLSAWSFSGLCHIK